MNKFTREPLVHFLLLGALLFALHAWREARRPDTASTARIEVTAAVIERLRAGYERQFGRPPDEEELRGLVTAHLREEVLYREALALGLDRDDSIVRRRLAQKMEFLTDDTVAAVAPDEAALRGFFTEHAARYARPARVGFRHVYISREKRGAAAEAAARDGLAALRQGADDETLGDAFLHGFEFAEREPEEIAALFGPEFAGRLGTLPADGWHGPVASSYGLHLVKVGARTGAEPAAFEAVRAEVLRDFHEERRRVANREAYVRLKGRYAVTVDEAAILRTAARPLNTAGVAR